MNKAISLCLWRRPSYTKRVLDALKACEGISEYHIFASVDGPSRPTHLCAEVAELARRISFADRTVMAHKQHLGCNKNTREALSLAFAHCSYVIHVEDDVVLSKDALRWFEFAGRFSEDRSLITVSAWRNLKGWLPGRGVKPENEDAKYGPQPGLHIWGWATWLDRWLEMMAGWPKEDGIDGNTCWDTVITRTVRGNRNGLCPYVSRAINIGSEAGTHRGDHLLDYWAGSPGFRQPSQYIFAG